MPSNKNSVFKEPWYTPYHFIQKGIDIQCPKCGGHATSTGKSKYFLPWMPTETRLICKTCSYTKTEDEFTWAGPVKAYGRRPCGHCGHKWVEAKFFKEAIPKTSFNIPDIICPKCNQKNTISVQWEIDVFNGRPIDPFNGETLWYVDDIKGNEIWAYNLEHLVYLKNYFSSQIRERGKDAGKYSILTNLPKWMKLKKNRDAVIRSLDRLMKK